MGKNEKGFRHLLMAARNSLAGLSATFKSESAFRQDVFVAVLLVFAAFYFDVSSPERCALIICVFILLVAELLNSAVEKCVDLITAEIHPLAKFAKDAGSAAVFLAIVNILLVWGIVLWNMYEKHS